MKIIATIWIAVVTVLPASGQWMEPIWQLVDDFQYYTDGQILESGEVAGWETISKGNELSWFLGIPGDDNNVSLFLEPDLLETVWMYRELSEEGIPPGGTGTLYIRLFTAGIDFDEIVWGVSDVPPEDGQPEVWEPYTALCRIDRNGTDNVLQSFKQDAFVNSHPLVKIEPNNWYHVWLVIENSFDGSSSTGSCMVYVRGPDDASPVSVTFEPDTTSKVTFRRPPVSEMTQPEAIRWVMLASKNPRNHPRSAGDPWLIDDIYYSAGQNLTDPTNLYPWDPPWVNEAKDVDTGDWMGWLNVSKSPYIWSYSLNGWIYMEEPVADAPGAWGYFYK